MQACKLKWPLIPLCGPLCIPGVTLCTMCMRHIVSYILQNNTSLKLLEMTWLRIEQFLPQFMKQLFPAIIPPTPQSPPQDPVPQVTPSPNHTLPSQPSAQFPLEAVVVQEIPVTVTMDHMTGGVSMAATPIQTPCSPSRSPDPSPHASPPTSSSPGVSLILSCKPVSTFAVSINSTT